MATPSVQARFEVLDFACKPEAVTEALAVSPTCTWEKGTARARGGRPHECSGWRLESPLTISRDLESHAAWLLDRLPPVIDLHAVTDQWYAQLSFIVEVADETPAISFDPGILARIARLGAGLDIDLYVFTADHMA